MKIQIKKSNNKKMTNNCLKVNKLTKNLRHN